jgi:hypothetical protein
VAVSCERVPAFRVLIELMAAVSQIHAPEPAPREIRLCSRCGAVSDRPSAKRVCDRCDMGVLLACRGDALPPAGPAAFVVCRHDLTVSAVSEAGEEIFGAEAGVVGTDLLELATCPLGDEQLARHARLAAQRPMDPVVVPLRLRSDRGERHGMLAARIATCGPPRAALVAVQRTGFGRR